MTEQTRATICGPYWLPLSLRTAMDMVRVVAHAPMGMGLPEAIERARANATEAERPAVERAVERLTRGDLELYLPHYPNWPEYPTAMPLILSPDIAHLVNWLVMGCALPVEDALDEVAQMIRAWS